MEKENRIKTLVQRVIKGERRAIADAISIIEKGTKDAANLLDALSPICGSAQRIGITGPPGSGKSTFTNQLVKHYRFTGRKVGIIAVDPSSPLSGGAIFGDRLRMKEISLDPDVFIRSMAACGSPGGLSQQATGAADVLDAAGKDIIIFETVGVGQILEIDIVSAADTIIVMTIPQAGDAIQCMKAGLVEVGHIFVVNKADLAGAENAARDLETVLSLKRTVEKWEPKVRLTESLNKKGFNKVADDIEAHYHYLIKENLIEQKRFQQKYNKIQSMVNDYLTHRFWTNQRLKELQAQIQKSGSQVSAHTIAIKMIKNTENNI